MTAFAGSITLNIASMCESSDATLVNPECKTHPLSFSMMVVCLRISPDCHELSHSIPVVAVIISGVIFWLRTLVVLLFLVSLFVHINSSWIARTTSILGLDINIAVFVFEQVIL